MDPLGVAPLGILRLGLPRALVTIAVIPTTSTFAITFPAPRLSLVDPVVPTTSTFTIAFPSPRLSVVIPVIPTTFTIPITFPAPKLDARISSSIRPTTFSLPITFPVVAIGGGLQTLQVWLGGIPITKYVKQKTCVLTSATQGRWTATMNCVDKTGAGIGVSLMADPTRGTGQAVLITEGGRRVFMGCLNKWSSKRFVSGDPVVYTLNCLDKSAICDHRVVETITYAAGTDIADVIRNIATNHLDGEGIAMTGVPASLGALELPETFDLDTVTQAFDRLATDALATWWVDVYGTLYFVSIANLPAAPFALTETSKNWVDMEVSASLENYRNKQWVKSNRSINPTDVPAVTETYTLPQPAAVAMAFRIGALILKRTANQIISIKVNGVAQPVLNGGASVGINTDKSWWAILPTPYIEGPDFTLPTPVPPSGWPYPAVTSAFPIAGDVIEITYIPAVNNAQVEQATALIPSLTGLLKCGSGVYEFVEQVKNVTDPDDMLAIAQAIIARSGQVPLNVNFKTFTPGLAVGHVLDASIPKSQVPNSTKLYISGITASHTGSPIDRDGKPGLGHGSGFEWQIQSTSGADQLAAIKIFEKLIGQSQNPLPVPQYETETFILAPGGSISSGTVDTNPAIARRSGLLVEVVVVCGTPPTDQTLNIDIRNSAYGSILKNLITIGSGDASVHVITEFVSSPAPTYMITNQALVPVATYTVTGSNPARAGSVTIIVRWQV